jgi:hypothetical protein
MARINNVLNSPITVTMDETATRVAVRRRGRRLIAARADPVEVCPGLTGGR